MKAIGLTIKAVLELDEGLAHTLQQAPRASLLLSGKALEQLKIGFHPDLELEPARLWVKVESVSHEREDDFLEE